jgi:hypothetical protein
MLPRDGALRRGDPSSRSACETVSRGRVSDDCDGFVVDPPGPRGETYVGLVDMDGLGGPGFHMDVERSERRHDPDYSPPEGLVLIGSADDTELVSDFELAPTCRAFVEGLRPLASIPGAVPTRGEPDAVMARRWPVRLLRR